MAHKTGVRWIVLVAANVAFWCMLSLQQSIGANPRISQAGGLSAIEQRAEIIAQLKEIKAEVRQLVSYRQNGSLPTPDPVQP